MAVQPENLYGNDPVRNFAADNAKKLKDVGRTAGTAIAETKASGLYRPSGFFSLNPSVGTSPATMAKASPLRLAVNGYSAVQDVPQGRLSRAFGAAVDTGKAAFTPAVEGATTKGKVANAAKNTVAAAVKAPLAAGKELLSSGQSGNPLSRTAGATLRGGARVAGAGAPLAGVIGASRALTDITDGGREKFDASVDGGGAFETIRGATDTAVNTADVLSGGGLSRLGQFARGVGVDTDALKEVPTDLARNTARTLQHVGNAAEEGVTGLANLALPESMEIGPDVLGRTGRGLSSLASGGSFADGFRPADTKPADKSSPENASRLAQIKADILDPSDPQFAEKAAMANALMTPQQTLAQREANPTPYAYTPDNEVVGEFNGRQITKAESERLRGKFDASSGAANAERAAANGGENPNLYRPPAGAEAPQAGYLDRSNYTEGERRGLQKRIDQQLTDLGPLNMRSKRELAGQLLGLKRGVTADRMGQLGEADKLVAGVENSNANLRDRSDARQQQAAQFAESMGLKRSLAGDQSKYLGAMQNLAMKEAEFLMGARGKRDEDARARVSELADAFAAQRGKGEKATPADIEVARKQLSLEAAANGEASDNSELIAGDRANFQPVIDAYNQESGLARLGSALGFEGLDGAEKLDQFRFDPQAFAEGKYTLQRRGGLDYADAILPGNQMYDKRVIGPDGKPLGFVYDEQVEELEKTRRPYAAKYAPQR